MGWAKRKLEEDEARGFTTGNRALICSKHFEDYAIVAHIEQCGKKGSCEYCDEDESAVIPFDELMDVIIQGISNHYGNPDDEGVEYDSREGGYQLDEIYDTYDLIRDEIMLEADEDVIEEIIDTIGMKTWCHQNPFTLSEAAELSFDWDIFCNLIKHESRFVFFKHPQKIDKDNGESLEPSYILEKIGRFIVDMKLFDETRKQGELFEELYVYRARQHSPDNAITNASGLGPPPHIKALNANRFSPAGIPMFYGSRRKQTAVEEIIDVSKINEAITVGLFKNAKPLNLIDLTRVPEVSIFDLERSNLFEPSRFLRKFILSVSQPVIKDGREHFEYVPTQVVTEYFRYVLPEICGLPVDGIKYKSSIDRQDCFVIFADQRNCTDVGSENAHTILILESDSIQTQSVAEYLAHRVGL